MFNSIQRPSRRVLIVSSHPLFGQGLRSLLQERKEADVMVVGIVSSVDEAAAAIEAVSPDLVIVDYDDERVNRDEFLARFMGGDRSLRVVLLSLKEGGSQAIVYDRRSMAAAEIDDWLKEWNISSVSPAIQSLLDDSPRKAARRRLRMPARISTVLDRVSDERRTNMRHFIFAIGLVIGLTALLAYSFSTLNLLPEAASLQAGPIDRLFGLHFIIIAFLFSLIVGFMLYSIIVFRRKPGDDTDAEHIEGNSQLEVIWTIVPLAVVVYISYLGAVVLSEIERPQPRPLEVKVVASQWAWRFEYPETGVVANELVLPVNRPVLFKMISTDVIHSFWVPEFRVKQDILPGGDNMLRELRITPTMEGNFTLRCAEMCGQLHGRMEAPVRVVALNDFDAWVTEMANVVPDDPAERGRLWAQQMGCLACHSTDGTTGVGPTWNELYGHEVLLEDGQVVIADEAYLLESIQEPGAKVVAGFGNIMPQLADQMTEEQIHEIIEFIKTLE